MLDMSSIPECSCSWAYTDACSGSARCRCPFCPTYHGGFYPVRFGHPTGSGCLCSFASRQGSILNIITADCHSKGRGKSESPLPGRYIARMTILLIQRQLQEEKSYPYPPGRYIGREWQSGNAMQCSLFETALLPYKGLLASICSANALQAL
jgi:hypothetical protein